MELRQIRKRSLVEKLVAEVRGQITAGRLTEGQQLPTEARMAAEFGVSRPLLREALAELRAEGFVETVNGRGTFVRHPSETDLADAFVRQLQLSSSEPDLTADHLYEARQAIELCSAALAAERATPELTATLERLLQAMVDSRGDSAAYTDRDDDHQWHVREPWHARRGPARHRRPRPGAKRDQAGQAGGGPSGHGRPPARVTDHVPRSDHQVAAWLTGAANPLRRSRRSRLRATPEPLMLHPKP